jgi:hypothetical protein
MKAPVRLTLNNLIIYKYNQWLKLELVGRDRPWHGMRRLHHGRNQPALVIGAGLAGKPAVFLDVRGRAGRQSSLF